MRARERERGGVHLYIIVICTPAHSSDKSIFVSVTIFPSQKCNTVYSMHERSIFSFSDKSVGQRVKILRNFGVKRSRVCLVRWRKKSVDVMTIYAEWRSSGFVYVSSRRDARTRRCYHEKTGSPLDLIGFDISRWGSSRRRLTINLYPVTRQAVPSQLNEAPPFFFFILKTRACT